MRQQQSQGLLYIILGGILLMSVASDVIVRLLLALLALTLIGKGMQLMGFPPLYYSIRSLFDRFNR